MTANSPVILRDGVHLPGSVVERLIAQPDTTHTRAWFDALPGVVDSWCEEWDITLDKSLPRLSYNIVLFGISTKLGAVVLKFSPPNIEFLAELEGLRRTQGDGVVKLHASDVNQAAIMLERVQPGIPLRDRDAEILDAEATRIAATCMKHFWREVPDQIGDLIPLERWFRDLFTYEERLRAGTTSGPLSADIATAAVTEAREMFANDEPRVVLHGDIHHDNLLVNQENGWTIIDPKGLVGDRCYEVGTWMLNPPGIAERIDLQAIFRQRIAIFSQELGMSEQRIAAGTLVHGALVAAWALIDRDESDLTPHDPWLLHSIANAGWALDVIRQR